MSVSPVPAIARQHADTQQVIALLEAKEGIYIPWQAFAAIAPCAWRTRISDARKALKGDGVVEWNKSITASAYRFRRALGRDAGDFVPGNPETGTLFDLHVSGWQR